MDSTVPCYNRPHTVRPHSLSRGLLRHGAIPLIRNADVRRHVGRLVRVVTTRGRSPRGDCAPICGDFWVSPAGSHWAFRRDYRARWFYGNHLARWFLTVTENHARRTQSARSAYCWQTKRTQCSVLNDLARWQRASCVRCREKSQVTAIPAPCARARHRGDTLYHYNTYATLCLRQARWRWQRSMVHAHTRR